MLVCHGLTNSMEKILEQSVVTQFVTNFPAFYGTRRFIAIYTSHTLVPVQSQMSSIHTPPCMPLNSILILYYHLHTGPPSGLFVSGFPTKFSHLFLISTMRATCPVNLILLYLVPLNYMLKIDSTPSHMNHPVLRAKRSRSGIDIL